MIERYALFQTSKLTDRFHLASGLPKGIKPRYNISPTQSQPVVVTCDGKSEAELMKWGFVPAGAKNANSVFRYKTYSARSEDVFNKPTWSTMIRSQRCLVPANGFYVWEATHEGRQPYFAHLPDCALLAMAGIYSSWQDPDGTTWGTYAIVTTTANKNIRPITNRMPVILQPDDEVRWLDSDASDINTLYDMMRPYPNDPLAVDKVSQAVNATKPDQPQLIAPL